MLYINDYAEMRGDLTLKQCPYNEIDYLIFSVLSYICADGIIGNDYQHTYTLKEFYQLYKQRNQTLEEDEYKKICNESHYLLEKLAELPRYQNIRIVAYVNDINKELVKQFSAMTFLLEDETMVIAYRGTDDSLVGWHEDFLMLCENTVPAQLSSLKYLQKAALYPYQCSFKESINNSFLDSSLIKRIKKHFLYKKERPIILVGHSKGGNLAMFSGCFCEENIQKRIQHIYNYDGPGFQEDIIHSPQYQNCLHKIESYIPHYSFFGIVLNHEEDYHVVQSNAKGMLQHNAFYWNVGREHFVQDELSMESVDFAIKVILFLEKLSDDDKHVLVDTMFHLFDQLELYTFSDLSHMSYKHILNAVKELSLLDSKVRKMLIEVLHMLWLEAKKTK